MKPIPLLTLSALSLLSGCNAGHGNDGDAVEWSFPAASVVTRAPVPRSVGPDPTTASAAAQPVPVRALVAIDGRTCLASLKAHSRAPRAGETVSIFRLFNAYPPRPGAVLEAEDVDVRGLRRVNISPDCLPSLPFAFDLHERDAEGGISRRTAKADDLYPIRALRLKTGSFLVLYAHRIIERFSHGGDAVAVSTVMFNPEGNVSDYIPQVSLYLSHEGSLWMEDATLGDEGLSITYTSIDPERQGRVGNVLEYAGAPYTELHRRYTPKNGRFERQPGLEDQGRRGIGHWDPAKHIEGYQRLTHP